MEGICELLHLLLPRLACYDLKHTDVDMSVTSVFLLEVENLRGSNKQLSHVCVLKTGQGSDCGR